MLERMLKFKHRIMTFNAENSDLVGPRHGSLLSDSMLSDSDLPIPLCASPLTCLSQTDPLSLKLKSSGRMP